MNLKLPGLFLVFKIFSFLVASWLLIHLLAIFGIFLILAYPVWRILLPHSTPDLYSRLTGRAQVLSGDRFQKMSPLATLKLMALNSLLILLVTVSSVALVYAESRLLFRLGFPPTAKTVSFVIPSKGQYRLGEIFSLKIEIANVQKPINAVQADVSFDPARLQVIDISTNKSFADIFIQKEINNNAGYARLSGGLPDPGFFFERGLFGTIFFQGKVPGIATVEFLPTSMVLANDGHGTNVLKSLSTVSYLILPETLTAEETELQGDIYLEKTVLGQASDEDTQLHLYPEEVDSKILGVTDLPKEIEQSKRFNPLRFVWQLIEGLNRFTLSFWHQILEFLHILPSV